MKKLLFTLSLGIFLLGCVKKNKSFSHPASHSNILTFGTESTANIGSFNIYLNDNLVGQLSAESTENANQLVSIRGYHSTSL
ncbi:hypothetical protein OAD66_02275 [Bacteroidia bacterium]|nr:hypothetical protein [Bacteroidia bacterium]MDB9881938.1 hypothetical protein [Bacteroidia bacterium]